MTPTSLSTRDAGWIIFILALGAGFSVASIYYAQPLLPLMGANLHLTVEGMGLVPTLTQAGYALGILFLLPLGDRHDRRRLITVKSALLALLLLLCSLTGQLSSLLVVSLLIGMAATMAQDIVPAAAIPPRRASRENGGHRDDRAAAGDPALPDGQRRGGRRIRLAGDVSGGGGQRRADWLVMWRVLPRFAVHSTLSYPQLMASMAHLWQRYPALRRAALAQGALSIAFSAFWSTLAVMLSEHYHMGSAVAGGFGIAGAAGALAAPLAGGLADKFGAGKVTQMGAALVTLSFALMFVLPLLPVHAQLALIALSAIGFDLGLQSSLVAHQNLVYGLEPQARGRLNALLFTVVFIGMSLGSVLGSKLYVLAGWNGVVTLAVITGALALAIRLLENARILAAERSAS